MVSSAQSVVNSEISSGNDYDDSNQSRHYIFIVAMEILEEGINHESIMTKSTCPGLTPPVVLMFAHFRFCTNTEASTSSMPRRLVLDGAPCRSGGMLNLL